MATKNEYEADEIGILRLDQEPKKEIGCGDVGYLISGIKNAKEVKVGDTITTVENPSLDFIEGFEDVKPMVFAGIYPVDTTDFEELRECMEKLQLNDASLIWEPETSAALGFGFRCGFLGMLHMEIIQERLRREFDMDVISTYPSVIYEVTKTDGEDLIVDNPSFLPEQQVIEEIREPIVRVFIMVPGDYIGDIMQLIMEKRGDLENTETIDEFRVMLTATVPLADILVDFNDRLKSSGSAFDGVRLLGEAQTMIAQDHVNGFLFQLASLSVAKAGLTGLWRNTPTQAVDLTGVSWSE